MFVYSPLFWPIIFITSTTWYELIWPDGLAGAWADVSWGCRADVQELPSMSQDERKDLTDVKPSWNFSSKVIVNLKFCPSPFPAEIHCWPYVNSSLSPNSLLLSEVNIKGMFSFNGEPNPEMCLLMISVSFQNRTSCQNWRCRNTTTILHLQIPAYF